MDAWVSGWPYRPNFLSVVGEYFKIGALNLLVSLVHPP